MTSMFLTAATSALWLLILLASAVDFSPFLPDSPNDEPEIPYGDYISECILAKLRDTSLM